MVRSPSAEELVPKSLCLWETQRPSEVGNSCLNSFSRTEILVCFSKVKCFHGPPAFLWTSGRMAQQ